MALGLCFPAYIYDELPHWEKPVNHREDFTEHAWDESYTMPSRELAELGEPYSTYLRVAG